MLDRLWHGIALREGRRVAFILFSCGIALRLLSVIASPNGVDYRTTVFNDEVHYLEHADNLIDFRFFGSPTQGFPNRSLRPPVYPALLSLARFIGFRSYWSAYLLNLICEACSLILLWQLILRISGKWTAALAGLGLYAFWGPAMYYVTAFTTESLSVSLLLLTLSFFHSFPRHKFSAAIGGGLSYTLLIHTRPAFLLTLPALLIWLFWVHREELKRVAGLRILVLAGLLPWLLCLPWTLRNYRVHDSLVPVCTVAGWHLFAVTTPDDALDLDTLADNLYRPENSRLSEGEIYKLGRRHFFNAVVNNPTTLFLRGSRRLLVFWGFPDWFRRIYLARAYVFPVLMPGGWKFPCIDPEGVFYIGFALLIFSIVATMRKHPGQWGIKLFAQLKRLSLPILFLLFYMAAHIIGIPLIQYRFVIEPVFILLLLCWLANLLPALFGVQKSRERSRFAARSICVCLLGLCLLFGFMYWFLFGFADTYDYSPEKTQAAAEEIRARQWVNRGYLSELARVTLAGVIIHPCDGRVFSGEGINTAEKSDGALGYLMIGKYGAEYPAGIMDIKLNFPMRAGLRHGDRIEVSGHLRNGPFREPLLQVDAWERR